MRINKLSMPENWDTYHAYFFRTHGLQMSSPTFRDILAGCLPIRITPSARLVLLPSHLRRSQV
jgi:hypothetical protein